MDQHTLQEQVDQLFANVSHLQGQVSGLQSQVSDLQTQNEHPQGQVNEFALRHSAFIENVIFARIRDSWAALSHIPPQCQISNWKHLVTSPGRKKDTAFIIISEDSSEELLNLFLGSCYYLPDRCEAITQTFLRTF
jgi:hypothetical protein